MEGDQTQVSSPNNSEVNRGLPESTGDPLKDKRLAEIKSLVK